MILLAASPAAATEVCVFDQACTLEQTCTPADWTFTVTPQPNGIFLQSGTDAARLFRPLLNSNARGWIYDASDYWELLEIAQDGAAMLMIGGTGPSSFFAYVGKCEDAN